MKDDPAAPDRLPTECCFVCFRRGVKLVVTLRRRVPCNR
jgi:hypothetical protein